MASVRSVTTQSSAARSTLRQVGVGTASAGWVRLVPLLLLLGCSGDWIPIERPRIEGMVHKGPFVRDSVVTATLFAAPGVPSDQVFKTQTLSDLGTYQLDLPPAPIRLVGEAVTAASAARVVWVRAHGAFFDEATGATSTARISLDALALLPSAGTQQIHVNLLTYLSYRRSLALWQGGMQPQDAIAQAEDELRQALRLAWPGGTPRRASQLSLVSEDADARSYLWAATLQVVVAAQYGPTSLGATAEARLLALIEQSEIEFAAQGAFSAALQAQYRSAWSRYTPALFIAPLVARLGASGASVGVPNLQRSLDTDGDGVADATDTCPLVANADQTQVPLGVCGVAVQELRQPVPIEPTGYFGLDVVDAAGNVHALIWYRGQGKDLDAISDAQGTFQPFTAWSAPPAGPTRALLGFSALAIGDVNGDGATDVLATSTAGTVPEGLYLSSQPTGFGQFVQTTPYPYVTVGGVEFRGLASPAGAPSVAVADFDHNGLSDMAGVTTDSTGARRLVLQLQSGPGIWDAPVLPTSVPAAATQVRSVVTGDLNADGNADLVCSGSSGVQVLLGNGSGGFAALPVVPACVAMGCPAESALVDFDRDGHLDLFVVATYPSLSWAGILYGSVSGQLSAPKQLIPPNTLPPPSKLRLADVNGDGWMDIVSQEGMDLSLYLNNKTGLTPPQRISYTTLTPTSTLSLFAGRDLNEDGRAELMLVAGLQAEAGRVGIEVGLLRLSFK